MIGRERIRIGLSLTIDLTVLYLFLIHPMRHDSLHLRGLSVTPLERLVEPLNQLWGFSGPKSSSL